MRLIDADALTDRLIFKRIGSGERGTYPGLESAIAQVKKAPTIDAVEVVHGRWECEHETYGKLQCSNCKKEALLEKANGEVGTILLYVTSNYCSNCGAKMDMKGE